MRDTRRDGAFIQSRCRGSAETGRRGIPDRKRSPQYSVVGQNGLFDANESPCTFFHSPTKAMRRRSPKTAAIYKEWRPIRKAFLFEQDCCVCDGCPLDVHEIVGGGVRLIAFKERCTWLRVCRTCHEVVQYMSKAKQMALKLLSDPEHFSIEKVCEIWQRAPTAIDPSEVLNELRGLLLSRNPVLKTY